VRLFLFWTCALTVLTIATVWCCRPAHACPPQGDLKDAKHIAADLLKNRMAVPKEPAKLDLALMLAPGNDLQRFNHDDAVTVTGYITAVKAGGIESSNCHAKDAAHRDVHIYIGATPNATKEHSIIVEVTPGMRHALGHDKDWLAGAISKKFLHKKVAVTGWLFDDLEHAPNAVNTNPKGAHNWRATIYEIHPVTALVAVN
jgi:hypothetical protein